MTNLMPGTVITVEKPAAWQKIRLIGIGGKLRSGKDTVADYLVEHKGWKKIGMSDALDVALTRQNPYIRIEPGEPLNKTKNPKFLPYTEIRKKIDYVEAKTIENVRYLLQTLGTEVGRNLIGRNTWVNVVDNLIMDHLADGESVIVTGVRFPNEIEMVEKYELGQTWYVVRPEVEGEAGINQHASETSVEADNFSVTLDNSGTLDDLYAKVDVALAPAPVPLA